MSPSRTAINIGQAAFVARAVFIFCRIALSDSWSAVGRRNPRNVSFPITFPVATLNY
jgi:hypothetical protein